MRRRAWGMGVAALALAGAFGATASGNRPPQPDYERMDFITSDEYKRMAIANLITSVRSRDVDELLRLDEGAEAYAQPEDRRPGAEWLIDHYAAQFAGPLRITFVEAENSGTGLLACIAPQGSEKGLFVMGGRDSPTTGRYRLTIGLYAGWGDSLKEQTYDCEGWS